MTTQPVIPGETTRRSNPLRAAPNILTLLRICIAPFLVTHKGLIPARVTVLVFGRDLGILIVAAILYAAVGRREFRPSLFGKANTLVQIAAVAAVLLHQLTAALWVADFRALALNLTMVLTVVSGFHYAWVASRRTGVPAGGSAGSK
jgi:cardiolipin synthase